jgi:hypothetical protein
MKKLDNSPVKFADNPALHFFPMRISVSNLRVPINRSFFINPASTIVSSPEFLMSSI